MSGAGRKGRVTYAQNLTDQTLNRSYDYDQVGRLWEAHSGNEADAHVAGQPLPAQPNGPYSQSYRYDVWGNMTTRVGWGGWNGSYVNWTQTYTNNRHDWMQYDAAGHMVNDGGQYTYDAAGRQTNATYPPSWNGYTLQQAYDGDGQRAKKVDNGTTTYYLRSSVLGGQVICELNGSGQWQRGYVYLGGHLLALQAGGVFWVAQDPVTKSQRITDSNGTLTTAIDVDPWGGETSRSSFSAFQPHRYTSYERDGNSNDQAGARTYHGFWLRFDQPDPYAGSYDMAAPQSFNRYSYVQNDPVNFADPTGLLWVLEGCSSITRTDDGGHEHVTGSVCTYSWIEFGGFQHEDPNPRGGGRPPPQTAVSPGDLKAYRDRIAGMLKDGCNNFLNGLLNEAKAETGKSYGGILATFDQIKFYWGDTGSIYGGFAYSEHGAPAATISNAINTEKMGGSLANQRDRMGYLVSQTTQDFLGETLHHVGAGGAYTDGVMANALNTILVGQGRDTPKVFSDRTMKDIDNASRYWHPKVWSACPAPRR